MPGSNRVAVAAATAVLAMAALTACTAGNAAPAASSASQEGTDVDLQSVYAAISAADPGAEDPLGTVSTSGMAKTLSVSVLVAADEPMTTDRLVAILVAIRDTTPASIETVTVIARDVADEEKIVDLSTAVAGLPDDVTALHDGGVTLSRVDLEKL
ncbi:hypothetical protein GCM10023065_20490 [Microbacterium laevaniformans]|uniref:hypothetical protein n=1 Tax=Microbacterium laevaniformans TaxID=36807 RepID=UPI0019564AF3|nr:hypothetical protein [Microbacterium laevaniformans]MBM7753003.1 hypothetical protein [Microbacterium laevaniformans]GLJ64470.1 hypothetical protein GCM10017578_13590 [Microbacterium laevaniformans]